MNTCNDYNNYEHEIELKDLLFSILYRWRSLLLAGLIGMALIGGYKFATSYENSVVPGQNNEEFAKILKQKEAERMRLATMVEYYSESPLMYINGFARPTVEIVYSIAITDVKTDELYIDPVDAIVAAYTIGLDVYDEFNKNGIDGRYAEELYTCDYDVDSNTVQIIASGPDKEMAKQIADIVAGAVENKKDKITSEYREHSLKKVAEHYYEIIDQDLVKKQNSFIASIKTRKAELKNLEDEIAKLKIDSGLMGDNVVSTKGFISKSIIKYFILGAILGVFIVVVWYCVIYVLKPILRTENDIINQYGIPVIGVLPKKQPTKPLFIDKLLMKLEGRCDCQSAEETIKTASISISNTANKGSRVVVITSMAENKAFDKVAEKLNSMATEVTLILLRGGIDKANNVEELSKCDAVVLVEERDVSSLNKISEELRQIKLFDKKVLGAIIV